MEDASIGLLTRKIEQIFHKNFVSLATEYSEAVKELEKELVASTVDLAKEYRDPGEFMSALGKMYRDFHAEIMGPLYASDISLEVRKQCAVILGDIYKELKKLYTVDERRGENSAASSAGERTNVIDFFERINQRNKK